MDYSREVRNRNREERARAIQDAPARAARLTPEVVGFWREQIRQAMPLVRPGSTTCDYGPWSEALLRVRDAPVPVEPLKGRYDRLAYTSELMSIAQDIASPAWPDPRRDLIEFALAFLEGDVMLFRSGYTKRHLLTRLRQAPLTVKDIDLLDALLRRTVLQGSGLEEYRAWCRLAGHLVKAGHLSDFHTWTTEQANGAVLTLSMADAALWQQIREAPLPAADRAKVEKVRWIGPSKWGVRWPEMDRAVPNIDDLEHRVRRNAWRMVDRIARVGGVSTHDNSK